MLASRLRLSKAMLPKGLSTHKKNITKERDEFEYYRLPGAACHWPSAGTVADDWVDVGAGNTGATAGVGCGMAISIGAVEKTGRIGTGWKRAYSGPAGGGGASSASASRATLGRQPHAESPQQQQPVLAKANSDSNIHPRHHRHIRVGSQCGCKYLRFQVLDLKLKSLPIRFARAKYKVYTTSTNLKIGRYPPEHQE